MADIMSGNCLSDVVPTTVRATFTYPGTGGGKYIYALKRKWRPDEKPRMLIETCPDLSFARPIFPHPRGLNYMFGFTCGAEREVITHGCVGRKRGPAPGLLHFAGHDILKPAM